MRDAKGEVFDVALQYSYKGKQENLTLTRGGIEIAYAVRNLLFTFHSFCFKFLFIDLTFVFLKLMSDGLFNEDLSFQEHAIDKYKIRSRKEQIGILTISSSDFLGGSLSYSRILSNSAYFSLKHFMLQFLSVNSTTLTHNHSPSNHPLTSLSSQR